MPCTCYTELEFFPPHTHRLHPLPLLQFQKAPRLLRLHLPTREKATVLWSSSKQSRPKCCFFFLTANQEQTKNRNQSAFSRIWHPLHVFPRLTQVAWFCFEFWLVHGAFAFVVSTMVHRSITNTLYESSNYQIWGSDTACTEKNSRWTHPWVYAINYSLEVESTLTMSNSFSFSSYSTFSSSSLKSGANALQFSCAKIQRPTIVWKLLLTFILLRLLTSEPWTTKPN